MKTRTRFLAAALLALLLGVLNAPANAQVLYGSIVGSVADPNSAAVANATVTIRNKATG